MVQIVEVTEDDSDEAGNDIAAGSPPVGIESPSTHQSSRNLHSPPGSLPEFFPPESQAPSPDRASSHGHDGFSRGEGTAPNPTAMSASHVPEKSPSPEVVLMNLAVTSESMVTRVEPGGGHTEGVVEESGNRATNRRGGVVGGGSIGGGWGRRRPTLSILRRAKRENLMKNVGLGLRVCGFVFCLISFSVLAADRNKGWALDSFDRYKEFRYCLSVTVIGAAYSGVQLYHLIMGAGKILPRHFRCYFDFFMDQILSYLLVSASSSAATRADDWRTNWGPDKFPEFAAASLGMSFMAFLAFSLSSLISGYTLSTTIRL